jgi:hypothetical protein
MVSIGGPLLLAAPRKSWRANGFAAGNNCGLLAAVHSCDVNWARARGARKAGFGVALRERKRVRDAAPVRNMLRVVVVVVDVEDDSGAELREAD